MTRNEARNVVFMLAKVVECERATTGQKVGAILTVIGTEYFGGPDRFLQALRDAEGLDSRPLPVVQSQVGGGR